MVWTLRALRGLPGPAAEPAAARLQLPVHHRGHAHRQGLVGRRARRTLPVSGPFKFETVTPGQQLDLVRNDNYKDAITGEPAYLDGVIFKWYGDADTMIAAYAGGEPEYDLAKDLNDADLPKVDGVDKVVALNSLTYEFLRPNWDPADCSLMLQPARNGDCPCPTPPCARRSSTPSTSRPSTSGCWAATPPSPPPTPRPTRGSTSSPPRATHPGPGQGRPSRPAAGRGPTRACCSRMSTVTSLRQRPGQPVPVIRRRRRLRSLPALDGSCLLGHQGLQQGRLRRQDRALHHDPPAPPGHCWRWSRGCLNQVGVQAVISPVTPSDIFAHLQRVHRPDPVHPVARQLRRRRARLLGAARPARQLPRLSLQPVRAQRRERRQGQRPDIDARWTTSRTPSTSTWSCRRWPTSSSSTSDKTVEVPLYFRKEVYLQNPDAPELHGQPDHDGPALERPGLVLRASRITV